MPIMLMFEARINSGLGLQQKKTGGFEKSLCCILAQVAGCEREKLQKVVFD